MIQVSILDATWLCLPCRMFIAGDWPSALSGRLMRIDIGICECCGVEQHVMRPARQNDELACQPRLLGVGFDDPMKKN